MMKQKQVYLGIVLAFGLTLSPLAFANKGGETPHEACTSVGGVWINGNTCAIPQNDGGDGGAGGQGGVGQGGSASNTNVNTPTNTNSNSATNNTVNANLSSNTNTNTSNSKSNVKNRNTVNDANTQGQQQGQLQGQSIDHSGNSHTGNGIGNFSPNSVSLSSSSSTSSATTNQSQSNDRHDVTNNTQDQATSNSANNTGTSSTNVTTNGDKITYEAQSRNPVNTAIAPVVVTGTDQCLTPVSVGVQSVLFGVSSGSAVRDKICEIIKMSRLLEGMGEHRVALQLLASDPRVAAAIRAVRDGSAVRTSQDKPTSVSLVESEKDRHTSDTAHEVEMTNAILGRSEIPHQ